MDQVFCLFSLTEDHLAKPPAGAPVKIDLGIADILVFLAAQHDLCLLNGKLAASHPAQQFL